MSEQKEKAPWHRKLPSPKISTLFFLLALMLNLIANLAREAKFYSDWIADVAEFTILLPLLVYAWQMITLQYTEAVIEAATQVKDLVGELPDIVSERIRAEVYVLQKENVKLQKENVKLRK